ncbi:extracellular solute-binding protein [Rhizobium ruizarguesonis]|uniref:ABC transporter substrate-binding protein n=1 Tax=Rhizobium ruizarguesonis TaxID=2081791 RepID=UPI00102F5F2E|nr:extracellular solute-binding protein [Rhizobium ruizarguesonis]NKJ76220.1 extracellular solute-binding protein [Rhizobium leguminosarum bv. viciae]NKL46047.1 extracellular solute-binding protein [Rhizobium leguminosarum bv. viciae]NKQ70389.1 ABC transporter substrate-binding protein [Rhizobium ruizarguesonis]NKQ76757.1 ABC transporter substrate-binding protein [Rhizobium ruizarguesonis]TAW00392.1 extracellular solute-binding protein [Rhizobium ruizarguesonis]
MKLTRRTVLAFTAAATLAGSAAVSQAANSKATETRGLDDLYKAALKEGGRVIVYAGGDTPGQQDGIKKAFETRFPGVTLDVVVDYSKFHEARIDNQVATGKHVADVIQIQTLQNFPRWKAEGILVPYKPTGWDKVYAKFRDPDGAYTGVFVDAFSNVVNSKLMPDEKTWPREAKDYLRPEFKGKLVLTYPTDDDAVLFWFKQVVDKYGWDYVEALAKQEPIYVRGTQAPADMVESGAATATFSTDGGLVPFDGTVSRFVLPKEDPFVAWPQQAAILKGAPHPDAAKLYLSWLLDKDTQKNVWYMWSVRTDVAPPAGYKRIWEYSNGDPTAFGRFLSDRGAVERFRAQIGLYLGESKGEPSPGHPGLYPEKALPH